MPLCSALVVGLPCLCLGAALTSSSLESASSEQGYVLNVPATLDETLKVQADLDEHRSLRDCFCSGSHHKNVWLGFYTQLQEGLAGDSSFSREWVHGLCGMAYPVIFRVIAVEPEDDAFTMHTDCPAGLLAMLVVCTQSAALQHAQAASAARGAQVSRSAGAGAELPTPSLWKHTERVVLEEGESVGDVFGPLPLEECLSLCEKQPLCQSLAFGPNGCHLKAHCVLAGEPMVPEGVQGDDYQTYYRHTCTKGRSGPESPPPLQPSSAPTRVAGQNTPLEDMQNMIRFALRALEFCFHCLDASPWPFLLGEVLENYALAVEVPGEFSWQRAAGRLAGPSTRVGDMETAFELSPAQDEAAALSPLRRTLLRLQLRWVRGFEMEAEFWRKKLSLDPSENISLERLQRWLATGEVTWFLDGDNVCGFLTEALKVRAPLAAWQSGPPRVLNAGSGPFAPRPLQCDLDSTAWSSSLRSSGTGGSDLELQAVPVVATDGMARFYLRVFDENGFRPLFQPQQCPVEELHSCFPPAHFDVAHMRNALDHSFDPLLGLRRMLHVLRPGGWLLLRHARNEGVPGKFRNGLHQWAFDVEGEAGDVRFIIWNPELRLDVTAHLLDVGLAAEVRAELRQHPSADAPPDEQYVWVDIRKPTESESARKLTQL